MVRAKNYETVSKFVKVMPRILWLLFLRTLCIKCINWLSCSSLCRWGMSGEVQLWYLQYSAYLFLLMFCFQSLWYVSSFLQFLTCISQKLCLYFCSYKQFSYFQGAHSPEEPGRHGKVREFKSGQGKKEKSGKVCSCIWSITVSIDLDTKCAKKNYLLGKVVHHMMCKQRLSHWSILKNIVVIKMLWNNVRFVFYRYCCEGQCRISNHLKCGEKSGNLIMTGEWPPCILTNTYRVFCQWAACSTEIQFIV